MAEAENLKSSKYGFESRGRYMSKVKESSPTSVGNAATLTTRNGVELTGESMLVALLLHCTTGKQGRGSEEEQKVRDLMQSGQYFSN